MAGFSCFCIAIAQAAERGTLSMVERLDRFGETMICVLDEYGTIEVHTSIEEAQERIDAIIGRAKKAA